MGPEISVYPRSSAAAFLRLRFGFARPPVLCEPGGFARGCSCFGFGASSFGICFGFRASDFGFGRLRGVVWEVEPGVWAVVLSCGGVAGEGGLDLVGEQADVDGAIVDAEVGDPSVRRAAAVDASESRAAARGRPAVAVVLGPGADAQVAAAVVQAVAVDVVDDHPLRRPHDHAVHEDGPAAGVACGVEGAAAVRRRPRVPAEPLVVGRVHDRELVLRQRDVADVRVRRGRRAGAGGALAPAAEIAAYAARRHAHELAVGVGVVHADEDAGAARFARGGPAAGRAVAQGRVQRAGVCAVAAAGRGLRRVGHGRRGRLAVPGCLLSSVLCPALCVLRSRFSVLSHGWPFSLFVPSSCSKRCGRAASGSCAKKTRASIIGVKLHEFREKLVVQNAPLGRKSLHQKE